MSNTGGLSYESGRDLVIGMGERMRIARQQAQLEQEEMAELLGVSSSTVSNWENGRTSPKAPFLMAWAQATGFKMSSLIPPAEPNGHEVKLAGDVNGSADLPEQ